MDNKLSFKKYLILHKDINVNEFIEYIKNLDEIKYKYLDKISTYLGLTNIDKFIFDWKLKCFICDYKKYSILTNDFYNISFDFIFKNPEYLSKFIKFIQNYVPYFKGEWDIDYSNHTFNPTLLFHNVNFTNISYQKLLWLFITKFIYYFNLQQNKLKKFNIIINTNCLNMEPFILSEYKKNIEKIQNNMKQIFEVFESFELKKDNIYLIYNIYTNENNTKKLSDKFNISYELFNSCISFDKEKLLNDCCNSIIKELQNNFSYSQNPTYYSPDFIQNTRKSLETDVRFKTYLNNLNINYWFYFKYNSINIKNIDTQNIQIHVQNGIQLSIFSEFNDNMNNIKIKLNEIFKLNNINLDKYKKTSIITHEEQYQILYNKMKSIDTHIITVNKNIEHNLYNIKKNIENIKYNEKSILEFKKDFIDLKKKISYFEDFEEDVRNLKNDFDSFKNDNIKKYL